jgi:uncharacterized protein (TIGR02118 family)
MGAGEYPMVKLVILIPPLENWSAFDRFWPRFLHQAESMPGLRREATSHVGTFLYGAASIARIHELFFDSLQAAQHAMASPHGQEAGRLLQAMTGGKVALFLADHKEDTIDNIRSHRHGQTLGGESESGSA